MPSKSLQSAANETYGAMLGKNDATVRAIVSTLRGFKLEFTILRGRKKESIVLSHTDCHLLSTVIKARRS